jgi:hypothetical protein
MEVPMRRTTILLLAAFAVVALVATGALAKAPKFHSATSSVNNDGALVVSFDERGLGHEDVTYRLTADSEATWACINRGGKNPSAANKRSFQEQVTTGGTFQAKNGRVRATLVAGPPGPGDFSCPPGQRLVLADVSYFNIVLTDVTNDVSTSVPDASRTFFNV